MVNQVALSNVVGLNVTPSRQVTVTMFGTTTSSFMGTNRAANPTSGLSMLLPCATDQNTARCRTVPLRIVSRTTGTSRLSE